VQHCIFIVRILYLFMLYLVINPLLSRRENAMSQARASKIIYMLFQFDFSVATLFMSLTMISDSYLYRLKSYSVQYDCNVRSRKRY